MNIDHRSVDRRKSKKNLILSLESFGRKSQVKTIFVELFPRNHNKRCMGRTKLHSAEAADCRPHGFHDTGDVFEIDIYI